MKPPILMIHGGFCGGWCFDGFRDAFEDAGWMVAAPDLPGHGADAGRRVANLSLGDYARAVVRAIDACPTPPVLLGHSLGGLVVQLAAAKRAVAGLILLAPSPAWGQPPTSAYDLSAGFALTAMLGPYWMQAVAPDWEVVRSATLNQLPTAQARALYARMGPESGLALFQTLNWWLDPTMASAVGAQVVAPGAPALVIGGSADQVNTPAALSATGRRLGVSPVIVPGLSHWTMGGEGSNAAAELCLAWLDRLGSS